MSKVIRLQKECVVYIIVSLCKLLDDGKGLVGLELTQCVFEENVDEVIFAHVTVLRVIKGFEA